MSYLRDKFKMFMSMAMEVIVAAALRYKGILTTQEGNTADYRVAAANNLYCISTSGNFNNPRVNETTTLNTSLVKVATENIYPSNRYNVTAAANDEYIMFAGGDLYIAQSYDFSTTVEAFNNVLTRITGPALTTKATESSGANIGNYLLIAGGRYINNRNYRTTYLNTVNAYNKTLTKSTPTKLSVPRANGAGIGFANRAFIIGGINDSTYHSSTDTYDSSLVRRNGPTLSFTGSSKIALVGNNLMVFENDRTKVNFITSTFTRTILSDLPFRLYNQPVSVGANNEFCVVPAHKSIIVYDSTLTRTDLTSDIGALTRAGGASFNGTGLIYPGRVDNTASNDIYYFQYN